MVKKGFTLIEVLAALVVTVIGLGGMFMVDSATSHAQLGVRDMVIASRLAHFVLTTIKEEALEWTINGGQEYDQGKFKWLWKLRHAPIEREVFYKDQRGHGTPVGPVGNDYTRDDQDDGKVHYDQGVGQEFPADVLRRYCVWYSMYWLVQGYSARVTVIVGWPSSGTGPEGFDRCNPSVLGKNGVYFVTASTVISRNGSVR